MAATPLINSLHDLRRKVKVLSVTVGIGIVLASVVGVVVGAVLLDYMLNLRSLPRLVVILAALFGVGAAIFYQIIRPAMSKLSISDIAGRLEEAFPEFDDSLRSTVDFLDGHVPGSQFMMDQVVAQASSRASQSDLNRAIVLRPVVYSLAGGIGAILLAIALAASSPSFAHTALARLLNPFTGPAWPKRVQIDAERIQARVPVGQAITVKMKLVKGDRPSQRAIVYYQSDNGVVQQEYMTRAGDSYTATFDARGDHMKVWMSAGDDQTDPSIITVVQRLQIARIEAVITPPAYAKLPPVSINLNNGSALATVGSGMALKIYFNKPLDMSKPVVLEPSGTDSKVPGVNWDRAIANQPLALWSLVDSTRFRVHATDTDGFSNAALEEYEIIARPDQPPTVQIEEPRRNMELTAEAHLPTQIVAEDDFGITNMTLIVDRITSATSSTTQPAVGHWEIPLTGWKSIDGSADRVRFRMNYDWELAQTLAGFAPLKPGDVLEYFVTVKDNFDLPDPANPDGPHLFHAPVPSGKLRINIISQEELANLVTNAQRELMNHIEETWKSQTNSLEQTKTLANDTKGKPEFNKGDQAAGERIAQQQSALTSQTQQIANQMQGIEKQLEMNRSPRKDLAALTKEVKDQLNQTAENPMKEAAQNLNEANQSKSDPKASPSQQQKSANQLSQNMANAQNAQQTAADQLKNTLNKMSTLTKFSDIVKKWEDLNHTQKEITRKTDDVMKNYLGKKPEDMNPKDRQELADLAKEQEKASQQADKATTDTEKTSQQMEKSDPSASQAMKSAASQSKSQGIQQKAQQASSQMQQNQSSAAHNSQQQVELGLKVVLDTLKAEEQRKLEELAAKLDEAQKAIENLVRHQSGINIDNLSIRGGEALKLISEELLKDADRLNSEVKVPVPTVPQLTEAQEQTERNTRDVAKKVEALPDGSGPSAKLVLAAGKMGYAITSLRDTKLVEAYDPHQVGALALLKEALDKIAQQKDDAEQQEQEKQKEKIREAYVKIRDEQKGNVNEPTQVFDTAKGHLKREQEQALAKLPGVQGDLAKRIGDIGKDLETLDSVVYKWANDDIASSMRAVKDDLAKPDTGAVTQAEQARVLAQLNAMIDDLATKPPKQSKFANSGGGGGGGGGGSKPKMPTEAELRLLKDLQVALHDSTKTISALERGKQEAAKLVSLGDRQKSLGELLNTVIVKAGGHDLGPGPSKDDVELPPELPVPKHDEEDSAPAPAGPAGQDIEHKTSGGPVQMEFELPAGDATPADAKPASGDASMHPANKPSKVDESLDDQELEQKLLREAEEKNPKAQQPDEMEVRIKDVHDNMVRSKIRLGDMRDPGETTQKIQERVIFGLNELIEASRSQSSKSKSQSKGQKSQKPGEGQGQANNQGNQPGKKSQKGGSQAAQESTLSGGDENAATLNDIQEKAADKLGVSPRLHDAVIEAKTEHGIVRDQSLIEDYYRSIATDSTEKK